MLILCITGGIACGKSETGKFLAELGFEVLDTDQLVHRLMEPGQKVHSDVVKVFGDAILDSSGGIDRKTLGKLVFGDPSKRKQLEGLTHPAVVKETERWISDLRRRGKDGAVLVPLYFEAGISLDVDSVVCLVSSRAVMLQRLEKRGLDHGAAEQRIAAQMPLDKKASLSDHVIRNDGSLEDLREAVSGLAETLRTDSNYRRTKT